MELPQKRGQTSRPLRRVIAVMLIILMMTTTTALATVESSNGVATTQSYTYFADVPNWAQSSVAKCINDGLIIGTGTTDGVIKLDLSQDFTRTIVLLDRAGYFDKASDMISEDWFLPELEPTLEVTPEISQEDRTSPIYEVYKNGYKINVTADLQWTIHDLLVQYNYDSLEKIIFGMAVMESTFNPSVSNGGCYGLYQIQKFWINGAAITHFTDDYRSRNLCDPYDATLTLLEMWEYAINSYDIDISTDQGIKDLLYWHNTGSYRKNVSWAYSNTIFKYAAELVLIEDLT